MSEPIQTELIPAEGDKEVGHSIFAILNECLKDKERLGLPARWRRNDELARNKHWKRESKRVALVSVNLLHTHRERSKNMLTDNNPTFDVTHCKANDEGAKEVAETLQRTTEYWWREEEQQSVFEDSVLNGETYNVAIEKSMFNAEREHGLGEAESITIDPFQFAYYPVHMSRARDLQSRMAVFHFYPMHVLEGRRRWPEFAKQIVPDKEYFKEMALDRREIASGSSSSSALRMFQNVLSKVLTFNTSGKIEGEEFLVCECWCRDYSTVKESVKQEDGTVIETEVPKYKGNIRYIVTAKAGDAVMEDRSNPNVNENLPDELIQKTYLYDKFPFVLANSLTDTNDAWGACDFSQLEKLNLELDKAISQLVTMKDRAARMNLLNPKTSGVSNEELTNYPNIARPANAMEAGGIKWVDPPPIPNDIIASVTLFKELFFLVSGAFDLDQGQQAGSSVIAYKAIAVLLERANTMMRGKIRSYSRLIRERGRMYLSHVMNFYTENRVIPFETGGQKQSLVMKGSDLITDAKLTVVSGSTMPVAKIQQQEMAFQVFGATQDLEDLLEKLDWSNRAQILKRREQGVFGQLIEKLATIGAPEPLLQFFSQIGAMEEKEFEQAMKSGDMPMFGQLMEQMQGEQENPEQQIELATKQAEIEKLGVEIAKADADRILILEKAMSEKVDQAVKIAGIDFDEEQLNLKKAELIQAFTSQDYKNGIEALKLMTQNAQQRGKGYQERGMRSNNATI